MDSIGDTLRRERLNRGLKLEHVATQTKIGQHYLQAMEENRFDRLPGGLFTRSFLRQYTNALDLNEEEIITLLKQQFEEPPALLPEPQRQDKLSYLPHVPALAWLVAALFFCGGVYSYWENSRRNLLDASAAVPHPLSHERPAILNRRASVVEPAKPLEPEFHSLEEPATAKSAASESGFTIGVAALHVVFAATEPVWVSIKSDGINAYSGTIEGQQTREFDAATQMTVLVGNAGGLAISLNGKSIALRGAHGEVQLVVLTSAGARVVPRVTPSPSPTPEDHSTLLNDSQPPAKPFVESVPGLR